MVLSFLYSTQKCNLPSLFDANTTGDAHSVLAGSIDFSANILSISYFSKSRAVGPERYETERIERIPGDFKSACFKIWYTSEMTILPACAWYERATKLVVTVLVVVWYRYRILPVIWLLVFRSWGWRLLINSYSINDVWERHLIFTYLLVRVDSLANVVMNMF